MNMAESRPRPVPKPRTRQKSLPNTPADLVGCLSSNFSTSPSSKPPITKPKPHGYKTLDFNNKGLVSITADIDITDEPVSGGIITSGNGRIENNNNITNLKDLKKKNATSNVWNSEQEKTSPLSNSYTKPLPPLPVEACPVQNRHNLNVEVTQSGKAYNNSSVTPPLPRKPPRMHPSASESHLESLRKNQNFSESSAVALSNMRNPPLPRKPTMLQRSSPLDVPQESSNTASRNHLGGPSSNNNIDSSEGSDISRTPSPFEKLNKESSSTASRNHSVKPVSSLVETKNTLSASNGTSNANNSSDNIGRTPPLPRKPARTPSPALEIHSAKGKDSSDGKSKKSLEQDSAQSRMIPKKLVKSPDGRRSSSLSPPTERPRPNSPQCNFNAPAITPSAAKGDMNFHKKRPSLSKESTNSSSATPEGHGTPENGIKHTHPRSLPGSTRQHPPEKPLPDLPSQDNTSFSPPRRPPPGLPKQPSLKGSGKKSGPPPLPKAPRPKSVWQANEVKTKDVQRSRSVGNLIEDCNEDEYWVAYQHLAQQPPRPSSETGESNGGLYEDPDHEAVKGFMDAVQQKARNAQSKEKPIAAKQGQDYRPSTYSSSSDDSANEYEEVDSPTPQRNEDALLSSSTVSSNESHGYVQPIPFEEHSEETKKLSLNKETSTKKFEFKPFHDMDGEWSETKEIKWEYEGESDDSDPYVEPDEDDDEDDDDDDIYELGDQAAEEPLYQIYQANVFEKERTLSLKRCKKDSIPQFSPTFSGNVTLRTGTMRGGKMLWAQLPEVRNSGILENIAGEHRKLQEAIFEVVSSEASYLKSLNLLVDHFLKSSLFSTDSADSILEINQVSELFSNIMEIVRVSESFLHDLRTRQRKSILIESISDIIIDHGKNRFKPYVTYCSTQYKQDRMLANLRKTNLRFAETLEKLERDSRVCGLTLQSFLVLPMQRVTRYPLLVDAIVRRCEPGHSEYYKTDEALKAVNKVVHQCNEGARNEERHEEMLQIDKVIAFLKMKPIQLVTDDRWLLRRGPLQLLEYERKATLGNTLRGKFKKYRVKTIYLYLFNDFLVVTKKKSETLYSVIDFAKRNMIRLQEAKSSAKNSFILVFLENFEKKTKELNVRADNETDLTRWREAFAPPEAETDDEKVYGTWDCPQFQAIHNYQAQQSDELSLVPGDVVNVLRKLPDGWYEGERIRDGMCGWFPANYTEEIRNEHVRARNLHQRYRLLAASTAFLDTRKR